MARSSGGRAGTGAAAPRPGTGRRDARRGAGGDRAPGGHPQPPPRRRRRGGLARPARRPAAGRGVSPEEQYRTPPHLDARIDPHARLSPRPGRGRWVFERELGHAPGARILEVGCGPATTLWGANLDRIDPSWRLTLSDSSPGMIEAARELLGDRAEYLVADVQELPLADESFDV